MHDVSDQQLKRVDTEIEYRGQLIKNCFNARRNWMDKWGVHDPSRQGQLIQVINRIKNAEKAVDR